MNGIETIIAILVTGLTFMVTVCGIIIAVSNMIDRKMKTQTEMALKVFDREMQEVSKMIDGALKTIGEIVNYKKEKKEEENSKRIMATKQDGFGII